MLHTSTFNVLEVSLTTAYGQLTVDLHKRKFTTVGVVMLLVCVPYGVAFLFQARKCFKISKKLPKSSVHYSFRYNIKMHYNIYTPGAIERLLLPSGSSSVDLGRTLEGFTYQLNSPVGLDLKLVKRAPSDPPRASESGHLGDESCPWSVPTIGFALKRALTLDF